MVRVLPVRHHVALEHGGAAEALDRHQQLAPGELHRRDELLVRAHDDREDRLADVAADGGRPGLADDRLGDRHVAPGAVRAAAVL